MLGFGVVNGGYCYADDEIPSEQLTRRGHGYLVYYHGVNLGIHILPRHLNLTKLLKAIRVEDG